MCEQMGGYIFGCTYETEKECLQKNLFGHWETKMQEIEQLQAGDYLFLFNYNSKKLMGVFTAAAKGAFRIDPTAWRQSKSGLTPFPAQIRVIQPPQLISLPESAYKQILLPNFQGGEKIVSYILSMKQVDLLIKEMRKESVMGNRNFVVSGRFMETEELTQNLCKPTAVDSVNLESSQVQQALKDLKNDFERKLNNQGRQNLVILGQAQSDIKSQSEEFSKKLQEQSMEQMQQFELFKQEMQKQFNSFKRVQQLKMESLQSDVKDLQKQVKELKNTNYLLTNTVKKLGGSMPSDMQEGISVSENDSSEEASNLIEF